MSPTFALGMPHTPWIPERVDAFAQLCDALSLPPHIVEEARTGTCDRLSGQGMLSEPCVAFRVFQDREPNRIWAQKLWRWANGLKAERMSHDPPVTHLLQVQDDCIIPPFFWKALEAIVTAVPDRVIALEVNHPIARELARLGKRWFRTRAWVVGVMYVVPLSGPDGLHHFVKWCDEHPELVDEKNEDQLISLWLASTGRDAWHPIPTIVDHDLTIKSVYDNDHQDHRRPVVTWHAYDEEAITDPGYWIPPAAVPLIPGPGWAKCYFCLEHDGRFTSPTTGATICAFCYARMFEFVLNSALAKRDPALVAPGSRGTEGKAPTP